MKIVEVGYSYEIYPLKIDYLEVITFFIIGVL